VVHSTANLRHGATALGILHGMYGIGGVVGPLVATAMVSPPLEILWARYYAVPLGLSLLNAALTTWAFWGYEGEPHNAMEQPPPPPPPPTADAATRPAKPSLSADVLGTFRSRVVLIGAVFIFAYQGAEVSISGWVISFLISARGGDPSRVGYVTSGFWGGITLGRFVLSPLGRRVGEKAFVYAIVAGAALFQLLAWRVPNVVGDAVAVAVVGLLLGPVWPVAAVVFTRNMSRAEQVRGLSIISAFGSSGGALAPFTTGMLAQAAGTFVLHPIAIGLCLLMLLCWYLIPGIRKRTD
jgi:fucose permease